MTQQKHVHIGIGEDLDTVHKNVLHQIHLEKKYNTWVFTDPRVGLVDEPFIMGMSEIINKALGYYGNYVWELPINGDEADMIFSSSPFPGHTHVLEREFEEDGGLWYTTGEDRGWLCPALFLYFEEAPEKIYVQVKETK